MVVTETAARFEQALAKLREPDRRTIAGIELGYTYQELADLLGKPSANAARVASVRAFNELIAHLDVDPRVPRNRRSA